MVKAHSPINWENEPSQNTPINETNLNKMDSTIGVLDDRIIEQDTSKLDKTIAYTMVKDISFNENNGVFTVTRLNGSTFTIDTRLEKIAINFRYDYSTQNLIITLVDGSTQSIDMSALLTQYEFTDSNQIGWEVTEDGKVKAKILNGSITEDMLQPNYLAEIKVETEKSAQSMANAKISENNAKQSELNAKASEEQALEYSNNAQPLAQSVSGNNPTSTNSADGNVIYLKNSGYIEQKSYSGKNLLPLESITDTGVDFTVNDDGTISIVGVTTGRNSRINLGGATLPAGTYTPSISDEDAVGMLGFYANGSYISKTETFTLSEEKYVGLCASLTLDVGAVYNIPNVKIQLEKGDTATEWEKYCGGTASPNPDYPQRIGGLADKGYFDGDLLQGYYALHTGVFVSDNTKVASANMIPCNASDSIQIEYEESIYGIAIIYFDSNKNYVTSTVLNNVSEIEHTAPANAKYFHFYLAGGSNTISPSTAKHICVTVNGQYALRVKTVNKNLFAFGKTAIDKTSELRPQSNQRLILSEVNKNTIKCNYNNGNYSVGHIVIDGIDGTKDYSISYTVSENTTTYSPNIVKNTTLSDKTKLVLTVNGSNGNASVSNSNYFVLSDIQVEYGTVATPFEPHQETTALIPVSAPFYDGDYLEFFADGRGYIVRENKVYGNPTLINSSGLWYWFNGGGVLKPYTKCYCDKLNHADNKIGTDEKGNVVLQLLEGQSIDDLATSIFVCKLANPTSTPLTSEQVAEFLKLRTYKGVTHVTADGDVVMRYYVDNASGETVNMLQGMVSNDGSSDLTELFKTITVSESATLPANQITSISIPINVPSGYSIFGIKSIHNNTLELLYGFSCGDDSVSVSVKNTSELETQGSVSVSVSCIKTSAIS